MVLYWFLMRSCVQWAGLGRFMPGNIPDIQAIGKALGAGYAPISASLVNEQIITGLKQGGGYFSHGHAYQFI